MSLSSSARDRAVDSLEERELFTLYRRRHRLRQEDVGERAGISQSYVSSWECGSFDLGAERIDALWTAAESLVAEREMENVA